jgi:YidC/Oxa1 family membrane protein insertase
MDLAKPHNIVLAVLAGVMQFLQAKMLSTKRAAVKTPGAKDEDMAATINKQMLYFLPIITIIFGYQFPAGVTQEWCLRPQLSLEHLSRPPQKRFRTRSRHCAQRLA